MMMKIIAQMNFQRTSPGEASTKSRRRNCVAAELLNVSPWKSVKMERE